MSRIGRVEGHNTASWDSGVSGGERQLTGSTGSRAICSGVGVLGRVFEGRAKQPWPVGDAKAGYDMQSNPTPRWREEEEGEG